MDLPPKLNAPIIEVRLTQKTWEKYVSMREEFVAYLNSEDEVSIVGTAPVKALRMAQICSGFLGGIATDTEETLTAEIGCELTNAFLDYFEFRLNSQEDFKLITWCRFRPEISRLYRMVKERFPNVRVEVLQGGQNKADKEAGKTLFHPDAPPVKGPALLIGQPQSGRFGLNFTQCHFVDYLSNDYSYLTRKQSEDRVDRPGQKHESLIQDYVVVGPRREKTISGVILKALRQHEELANWTCAKWVQEITEEYDHDVPF